jgi:hypothetical protein
MSLVIVMALVGLGPAAGAQAAPREAQAPSAPAGGTVGSGPGTCNEAALNTALAGGGTVTFNCGGPATILILSQKMITQSTTIDGGGIITITGGLATRLFLVTNSALLSLRDIGLDAGYSSDESGGAIANDEGRLSLERTLIQYSQTHLNYVGGAIFTNGPVTIRDSRFSHNSANGGGALYAIGPDARVEIVRSTFDANRALATSGRGGAIWVKSDAEVSIQSSSLSDNISEGDGGAVYNEGRLTSSESSYVTNRTTLDPTHSFRGYGGAIASTGPMAMFHDILYLNRSRHGGGVYVGGTASPVAAQVSHSEFLGNIAVFSGGGLYTSADNTNLTVLETSFQGNQANFGGGLSRNNSGLSIFRSSFGQNLATTGGGLASSAGPGPGSQVHVYDSTFYSNVVTATQGGAIYNQALMDLRSLTLEGNDSGVANIGANDVMLMANTVLHNVGLNCDGDGTKPQSQGGNFADDTTCALASTGDVQGLALDPLLGPVSATPQSISFYFVPLAGSPLINTATAACSLQDQRQAYRPDACDKGAIEFGGLLLRVLLPLLLR